jgi:hypothetical protein
VGVKAIVVLSIQPGRRGEFVSQYEVLAGQSLMTPDEETLPTALAHLGVRSPSVGRLSTSRAGVGMALVLVALLAAACTGKGSPGGSPSTAPPSSAVTSSDGSTPADGQELTPAQATALLLAASFDAPETLDSVEANKTDPAVVAAASGLAGTAPSGAPRWAVVYVLANATGAAGSLGSFLSDADLTIKVMAAIGAVGQGDKAGFAVLVDALTADAPLAGFEPPVPAWVAASLALARHTGLTLGPAVDADTADREASVARWKEWLASTSVQFDATTEEWR